MNFETIRPNLSPLTSALANLVYKDLSKDERLSNIQPQFDNNCGVFYLSAQKAKDQPVAFIPLPHSKDIDFELVKTMQQQLCNSIIYVAIIDNTGNILYYQITEGFEK